MDCSLPGSSVHGILQARRLEWVAIPVNIAKYVPKSIRIFGLKKMETVGITRIVFVSQFLHEENFNLLI